MPDTPGPGLWLTGCCCPQRGTGEELGGGESEGGVSVKDRRRDATIKHHLLSYQICGADTVSLRAGIISLNGC